MSTPQDVALSDVRKGIAMLKKVSVPVSCLPSTTMQCFKQVPQITGLVLNQSYYLCNDCSTPKPQYLFGTLQPSNPIHSRDRTDHTELEQANRTRSEQSQTGCRPQSSATCPSSKESVQAQMAGIHTFSPGKIRARGLRSGRRACLGWPNTSPLRSVCVSAP